MNVETQPFVSVVTPVYNMGSFLRECIESVLRQSYKNFEYVIVNNCSTDHSLDIALEFAKQDSRVRVHNNETFVGVIENHNTAFKLISLTAKYCKVVSADDYIFPECLMRMVGCAESNPSVGIVGSYQLSESSVKWQGFPYPKAVFSGQEICRKIFLGNDRTFGFGSPTSLLYRADLIRKSRTFYPDASPHADTSACFEELQRSDFGFVYEVLSYERIHGATQSSASGDMNRYSSAYLNDVIRYGPVYLSKEEFDVKLRKTLKQYYEFLAVNLFRARGKKFWEYHKGRLEELGFPITSSRLFGALITKGLAELKSPERAMKKVFHRA
jgi:glycosyltransferase involved in cell wall biosynthesis